MTLTFALGVLSPARGANSDELCERMMASCDEAIVSLKTEIQTHEAALETCQSQRDKALDRKCEPAAGQSLGEKVFLFLGGLFVGGFVVQVTR